MGAVRFHVLDTKTGNPVNQAHIEARITDHTAFGSSQAVYVNNTDGAGNSEMPSSPFHGYDVDAVLTAKGYYDVHNSFAGVSDGQVVNLGMTPAPPPSIQDPLGFGGAPSGQGMGAGVLGTLTGGLGALNEAGKEIGMTAAVVIGLIAVAVIVIGILLLILLGPKAVGA